VRALWLILAALPALAQPAPLPLPPSTLEVKWQQERLLVLQGNARGGIVQVLTREGRLLRSIEAGAGESGLRRVELKDFALAPDGALLMSLGAQYALGVTARLLASYPLKGAPAFQTLEDTVCFKLAVQPATGAWCLGPGLEETLLHRLNGPAAGPWSLAPPKKIRLLAALDGERREHYESGRMGVPALFTGPASTLYAYLPNSGAILAAETLSGDWRLIDVPVATNGRAILTFAAAETGLHALMPLRGPSDPELLTTLYAPFRLDPEGRWRLWPHPPTFPRGSMLAGVDGNYLIVWNRAASRLEWLALPN